MNLTNQTRPFKPTRIADKRMTSEFGSEPKWLTGAVSVANNQVPRLLTLTDVYPKANEAPN